MSRTKANWVRANAHRVIGLPLPNADEWMLQDTPLTRSTLECLKSNNLVETVDRKRYRPATKTSKATTQAVYRTVRHRGVFTTMEEHSDVPQETAEAFAARPDADLYFVEIFAAPDTIAARDIPRLCEEYDLDIQLIGVGPENPEPNEYPGRYVTVDRTELLNVQSRLWWLLPDDPDALVFSAPSMDEGLVTAALSAPTIGDISWIPTPEPGTLFDPWLPRLLRDEWLASRRRETASATNNTAETHDENQASLSSFSSESRAVTDRRTGFIAGQSSLSEFEI